MNSHPPLWIMAKRLAPHVASGLIDFTEALDTILEHIVRCRWDEYGAQLDLTQEWITAVLAREAERARHA